uniref:Reverse transcriptase domain-containing protein n=1 Tax=Panagrolaimus superbus TaxID=310955 RepID=A0A914YI62_9BILA
MKKVNQVPVLSEQYNGIIVDQLDRVTVEIAPRKPQGKLVHYLTHHAVLTPQKATTKVRMVFDGSAKAHKDAPSLNDCLLRGPSNLPDLSGLLLRLRTCKILITGDIEKAFHQVLLNEPDRDAVII